MTIGDSRTYTPEKAKKLNPFRSRSTIIAIACIIGVVGIVGLSITAGFFNETFGVTALMILERICSLAMGHQLKNDEKPEKQEPKIN